MPPHNGRPRNTRRQGQLYNARRRCGVPRLDSQHHDSQHHDSQRLDSQHHDSRPHDRQRLDRQHRLRIAVSRAASRNVGNRRHEEIRADHDSSKELSQTSGPLTLGPEALELPAPPKNRVDLSTLSMRPVLFFCQGPRYPKTGARPRRTHNPLRSTPEKPG